jgi:uncharacterized membrane protein
MEASMSHILVITFEDGNQALDVLKSLKNLEQQEMLNLEDAAVIVKDVEGKVQVKNITETKVKAGAAAGGFLGLVIGGLLFPVAGLALGAAIGAKAAKHFGNNVDKKFIKEVRESLTPGSSAILFIVNHENTNILITALKPYNGKIYQSSFDSAAEEEMRKALL